MKIFQLFVEFDCFNYWTQTGQTRLTNYILDFAPLIEFKKQI
jgi:hypothetical protein